MMNSWFARTEFYRLNTVGEALVLHSLSDCPVAKQEERERSKKNHTLPLELIAEILLRLPVRSVSRFKCACKSWLSLISDPQFGISHYDLAAAPSHRLLLRSNYFEHYDEFRFQPEILGSCRGFILLYYLTRDEIIIGNPSIGARKRLPDLEYYEIINDLLHGFGFSPSKLISGA
ncbi:F-box/kelch-repeat protein [Spatholobus suberectus]|nr:F-box/kelch-repeat protein [Spatholobus suberectus]